MSKRENFPLNRQELKTLKSLFEVQLDKIGTLSPGQQPLFNRIEKALAPKPRKKWLTCDDCGVKNKTVIHTPCPYASEINDDYTPMNLCEECSGRRAEEI